MSHKLTQSEFIERSTKVHNGKYDYSKVNYINNHTKVCIVCPEHGEFYQRPGNHLLGVGCPKCSHRSTKYTTQEFIEKAKLIHGDKYDYSKVDYIDNHTKVCIICPEHGEFWQTPNAHLNGEGCNKCHIEAKRVKFSLKTDGFIVKSREIHGDKYDYSKVEYVNNKTKVCIICPEHGEFWQTPNKHLIGRGCMLCGKNVKREKNRFTTEKFVKRAEEAHGDKYDYSLTKYIDYETPVKIICLEHGEFWQTPDSHLQGSGCQKCSHKESKQENSLSTFISEIIGKENVQTRVRKCFDTPQQELDILLPNLNIAIEYDGLRWHSEKFKKDKNYHLNKTIQCEKQGIRLIHVFENEWLEKENIVKSKIKHILGHDYDLIKVFARKCSVKEINYLEAREFLDKNHIQGSCNSTIYLGCYYNNELIGVMSFRREIKESNSWELTRFATDINKQCIGVGGKMFNYFIEKYNPSYIKSFADRRWSTGDNNLYVKLGFKLDKILRPDYKYVVGDKCIHKFNFRKQILLKRYPNYGLTNDMSEYEMTQKLGFYRIWDCGLYKFVWRK